MTARDYFTQTPALPLYHYTGISSFMKISQNGQIWASHIRYLNDTQELVHAIELFEEVIELATFNTHYNDTKRAIYLKALHSWIQENKDANSHHLYVFSLSEVPSLLSQWRSYTPHGKGVSIGFSVERLGSMARANQCRLGKCVYEQADKWNLFNALLETLWQFCDSIADEDWSASMYQDAIAAMANTIFPILALAKHDAFIEEQEWRFISPYQTTLDTAHFREGTAMLTPYIPLNIPDGETRFDSVIMGPTPHESLSLPALKTFCKQQRVCDDVFSSEIPYRVW